MDKKKIERLRNHASEMNYTILEDETIRLREALADDTITIRVPRELKILLKEKASQAHIPYQRFIKSVLIDALKKSS